MSETSSDRLAPVASCRSCDPSVEDLKTMSEEEAASNSSPRSLANVTARIQSSSTFSGPMFVLLMAMMVTLVVVIVLGNALVILAFKVDKSLRRQCNYYFLNLAISDFLVGKWCFLRSVRGSIYDYVLLAFMQIHLPRSVFSL